MWNTKRSRTALYFTYQNGVNMKEYAIILRANNHVVGRCLSYKKAANALACVIDSPTERAKYTIVPTINQRPANENRP